MEDAYERSLLEIGPGSSETVADCIAAYIESRRASIQRSAHSEYRRMLAKLIALGIERTVLDDLTPDVVQVWLNGLTGEFAPQTVRKTFVLLKSAMTLAVDRDRLVKNPTRTVKAPRLPSSRPNALDARGRAKPARFIAIDSSGRFHIAYTLAIYLGLHEGEACGLRWRSVDLDARTIFICETIGCADGKWYVKESKTGDSRHSLHIPDVLLPPLRERRLEAVEGCVVTDARIEN